MEQNRKIYQNLVMSPGYVVVIFETLKSASTLLQVSSITYPLYCCLNWEVLIKFSSEYHTIFFQCSISTVFDLFFTKIINKKSSLVSIQLLGTLNKSVKLVMQRFKYLLYFNSKFSLNLNESSFFCCN